MSRRPRKRGWYVSQGRLLLLIVLCGAVFYLYYHPELLGRLGSWISTELPSVSLPTTPPAPASATPRATPTPAPASAATAAPAATPPAITPGRSAALFSYNGAWYQLFFTRPRYPDKPEYHRAGVDERLVAFLNTASKTVDLAIYDFDLENVAQALASAAGRGVRVRMVTDSDTLESANKAVQRALAIVRAAGIPIVGDERPAIMHNKFVVVDAAAVWTGSWNFTDGDTYRLNNNAIKIVSADLAQNYTIEFEKLFTQRLFGPAKGASLNDPVMAIGGARVENYFAPEDQVAAKIVGRLQMAQQSIHFMAFSFTSAPVGNAMRERARAGVQVAGVFETVGSETQYSEYGKLRNAKIDVLQDGNPYLMHHKVIIIDAKTVIFGSFNFSNNADQSNDENLLIVDDPKLAQAFEAEFGRVREQALASSGQGALPNIPAEPGVNQAEMLTIE